MNTNDLETNTQRITRLESELAQAQAKIQFPSHQQYVAALRSADAATRRITRLESELAQANDLLCSACEIARRKGAQTAWGLFLYRIEDFLDSNDLRAITVKPFRLTSGDSEK